jgi:hypothetical protein
MDTTTTEAEPEEEGEEKRVQKRRRRLSVDAKASKAKKRRRFTAAKKRRQRTMQERQAVDVAKKALAERNCSPSMRFVVDCMGEWPVKFNVESDYIPYETKEVYLRDLMNAFLEKNQDTRKLLLDGLWSLVLDYFVFSHPCVTLQCRLGLPFPTKESFFVDSRDETRISANRFLGQKFRLKQCCCGLFGCNVPAPATEKSRHAGPLIEFKDNGPDRPPGYQANYPFEIEQDEDTGEPLYEFRCRNCNHGYRKCGVCRRGLYLYHLDVARMQGVDVLRLADLSADEANDICVYHQQNLCTWCDTQVCDEDGCEADSACSCCRCREHCKCEEPYWKRVVCVDPQPS